MCEHSQYIWMGPWTGLILFNSSETEDDLLGTEPDMLFYWLWLFNMQNRCQSWSAVCYAE